MDGYHDVKVVGPWRCREISRHKKKNKDDSYQCGILFYCEVSRLPMIWVQMVLPKQIQSYGAAVRQSKEQLTGNMFGWGVIWYVLAGALVIL